MGKSLKLIIVSGLPGVGKSTITENLSQKLKFPAFSVDPIESSIINSGIKRSFKTGLAAYIVVETLAAEQLKLGLSVIIDAVSPVKEARKMWQSLSDKYDAQLIIIECVLNPDLHKKRIEARVRNMHGIPEVTWEDVKNQRKQYLKWKQNRLILDMASSIADNVDKVLEYVQSPN
jgi:predicted kinase